MTFTREAFECACSVLHRSGERAHLEIGFASHSCCSSRPTMTPR